VAPLVTTSGSQTAAVAKPPLINAAPAATPMLPNHPIGSNVPSVKPPGITAIKNVQAAKAPATYLWVSRIKPQSDRARRRESATYQRGRANFLSEPSGETVCLTHRAAQKLA